MLYPVIFDEVLATQVNVTDAALVPVAESDATVGESLALLVTDSVPVTLPAVVGAKVTLKVAFCPEARVVGKAGPLKLNPDPVVLACETVTLPPPVFVTSTGKILVLPKVTSPKLRLVGLAESS
jgi:hypothetical protein